MATASSRKVRKVPRTARPVRLRMPVFKAKGPIYLGSFESGAQVRAPQWNFQQLLELGETHWLLRMIYRAILQESVGPGWQLLPRFRGRCDGCQMDYHVPVDKCEKCGKPLRHADEEQRKTAQNLIAKPNPDNTFKQILSSSLFHNLNCGLWWWSIAYRNVNGAQVPAEVYVESPASMRFVADEHGKLGKPDYFCPVCYIDDEKTPPVQLTEKDPAPICVTCGEAMSRTFYVHEDGMKISTRFSEGEVVVGSSDLILPKLYPTPKPVALWYALHVTVSMDQYNFQTYREGKTAGILNFPGYDTKSQLDTLEKNIEERARKITDIDAVSGRAMVDKRARIMMMASKDPISFLKIMNNPEEMQSLDFYKFYRDAVGSVYGVTPMFVSVIESGRSGHNPRMQIDVQNRTTREQQGVLEDAVNLQLFPRFGVTEWILRFNETDPEDELLREQIHRLKAVTALTWLEAGFNVEIDEHGELKITGSGSRPERPTGSRRELPMPALPSERKSLVESEDDAV